MARRQNFFRDDLDDHPVGLVQDRRDVREVGHCVNDPHRLQDVLVRHPGHPLSDRLGRRLRLLGLSIHECAASCQSVLLWQQPA